MSGVISKGFGSFTVNISGEAKEQGSFVTTLNRAHAISPDVESYVHSYCSPTIHNIDSASTCNLVHVDFAIRLKVSLWLSFRFGSLVVYFLEDRSVNEMSTGLLGRELRNHHFDFVQVPLALGIGPSWSYMFSLGLLVHVVMRGLVAGACRTRDFIYGLFRVPLQVRL